MKLQQSTARPETSSWRGFVASMLEHGTDMIYDAED